MNALLLQLVASRLGSNDNPVVAQILARITSGNAAGVPTTQELLAQVANGSDPTVSLFAKQITAQQAREAESRIAVVREVEEEVVPASTQKLYRINGNDTSMEEEPGAIQAEVKGLRSRCDNLASALGACPLCWGEDPGCRACKGRGHPGYAVPERQLFLDFVLPAVRMLKTQAGKNNNSSGRTQIKDVRLAPSKKLGRELTERNNTWKQNTN